MGIMQMLMGGPFGGAGIQATGGDQIVMPGNGYVYHTFTTPGPGTFTVTPGTPLVGSTVDLFMVGGGGYGENAGGGAGALIYKTGAPVSASGYPVVIGTGGGVHGATFSGPAGPYPASEGVDSTALGYTAAGGGHGGIHNQNGMHGDPGGSGGGGAPRNGGGTAGNGGTGSGDSGGTGGSVSPNNGWGNDGASANAANPGSWGGGGGGAGSVGSSNPGNGGAGLAYPDFAGPLLNVPTLPGTYAVGGPKGPWPGSYSEGLIDNTGNGGGDYSNPSTYGRPGIVVIRYVG